MDDAGGGAVSRLCDAVQSALDHRARRTLGRRVSDALGLDRLLTPAAIDAREATFAHRKRARETQKNGASPNSRRRAGIDVSRAGPSTRVVRGGGAGGVRAAPRGSFAFDGARDVCRDDPRRVRQRGYGGLNRGDLAEPIGARRDGTRRTPEGRIHDAGALLTDETAAARVVGALRRIGRVTLRAPHGNACGAVAETATEKRQTRARRGVRPPERRPRLRRRLCERRRRRCFGFARGFERTRGGARPRPRDSRPSRRPAPSPSSRSDARRTRRRGKGGSGGGEGGGSGGGEGGGEGGEEGGGFGGLAD